MAVVQKTYKWKIVNYEPRSFTPVPVALPISTNNKLSFATYKSNSCSTRPPVQKIKHNAD